MDSPILVDKLRLAESGAFADTEGHEDRRLLRVEHLATVLASE